MRNLVALTGVEPAGSKWLCFQYSWYSRMARNTAMDRRRRGAVVGARRGPMGVGEAARASEVAASNFRMLADRNAQMRAGTVDKRATARYRRRLRREKGGRLSVGVHSCRIIESPGWRRAGVARCQASIKGISEAQGATAWLLNFSWRPHGQECLLALFRSPLRPVEL